MEPISKEQKLFTKAFKKLGGEDRMALAEGLAARCNRDTVYTEIFEELEAALEASFK